MAKRIFTELFKDNIKISLLKISYYTHIQTNNAVSMPSFKLDQSGIDKSENQQQIAEYIFSVSLKSYFENIIKK